MTYQCSGEFNPEPRPVWAAKRGPLGTTFSAPPPSHPPPSIRERPQQARGRKEARESPSHPRYSLCASPKGAVCPSPLRGVGVQRESPGRGWAARGPCGARLARMWEAQGHRGSQRHRDKRGALGRRLTPGPGLLQGVWPAKAVSSGQVLNCHGLSSSSDLGRQNLGMLKIRPFSWPEEIIYDSLSILTRMIFFTTWTLMAQAIGRKPYWYPV